MKLTLQQHWKYSLHMHIIERRIVEDVASLFGLFSEERYINIYTHSNTLKKESTNYCFRSTWLIGYRSYYFKTQYKHVFC